MDGVLIDSEPLWREAEIIAFRRVGIELTNDMCKETMGIRIDQVVKYRYDKHGWTGKSLGEVAQDILRELTILIREKGVPMPGVKYALDFCADHNLRLALASSSHLSLIETVVQKFKIKEKFEVIYSAEFEEYGKPHPGIYLTTLQKLGLEPSEALAIEDSLAGLIAAKAAQLNTIAIPEPTAWHDTRFDIADFKLKSLHEFNGRHLQVFS